MNSQQQNKQIEKLYLEFKDHIYNYLARLTGSSDAAQDLTQQTFLKLMNDPNLLSLEYPKAYLFTVARNLTYDSWKKKREVALSDDEQEGLNAMPTDTDSGPDNQAYSDDLKGKVANFIMAMPEKQRELMILRYTEDMSIKEIVDVTGRKESDVKVNLHRARHQFETGFTHELYKKIAKSRKRCDELSQLLSPYGKNDIPSEQVEMISKHITTCDACNEDALTF